MARRSRRPGGARHRTAFLAAGLRPLLVRLRRARRGHDAAGSARPRHPIRLAPFGLRAALPAISPHRWSGATRREGLFGGARPTPSPAEPARQPASGWPDHGRSPRTAGRWPRWLARPMATRWRRRSRRAAAGSRPACRSAPASCRGRRVLSTRRPRRRSPRSRRAGSARVARGLRAISHGPGAFNVDLAVQGGVPWTPRCAAPAPSTWAGSFEEIAAAEPDVDRGRMPERPFVLVGQQYLADPGRSVGDVHPVWAYCPRPHGYAGDATEAVLDQIERFAPGLRERVVGSACGDGRRGSRRTTPTTSAATSCPARRTGAGAY